MNVNMEKLVVGTVQSNCYILFDQQEVAVIDPGADGQEIIKIILKQTKNPHIKILLTHGHCDHIGAVDKILDKWPKTEIYCGRAENLFLYDSTANLSKHTGRNIDLTHYSGQVQNLASGDEVSVGNYHFRVMETPGHTPGSLMYILDDEELVFCGDTIMKGMVGPTSLPFGDDSKLYTSIKERILVLPKTFKLLPGHGPETTVEDEKENNLYVKTMEKEETIT